MDADLENQLITSDKRNTKDKYGSHHYKLKDFGISDDRLRELGAY